MPRVSEQEWTRDLMDELDDDLIKDIFSDKVERPQGLHQGGHKEPVADAKEDS